MLSFRHLTLSAALLVGAVGTEARAQLPWTVRAVFNPGNLDVTSIALVADDGDLFHVAQLTEPVSGESRLVMKKRDDVTGLSSRVNLSLDGAGVLRLDTSSGEQYLPSIAIDAGIELLISNKVDAAGYGPTLENSVVSRAAPFVLVDDPPELVDDDSAIVPKRKHSSIAVNAVAGTVLSCWTVDENNDDTYCRTRSTASTIWTDPIFVVANGVESEEHASVTVLDDDTRVVLYADGTGAADGANLIARFFDSSNTEVGTGYELGVVTSNWPHLIRKGEVLHATWWDTASGVLTYATCDTDAASCESGGWLEETVGGVPNDGKYPQVAVDDQDNVFVAYTHESGLGDERVAVNARCSPGVWAGELVDGSQARENLGGDHVRHAYPAFVFEPLSSKIALTYARQDSATLEIDGPRASRDADDVFGCLCTACP